MACLARSLRGVAACVQLGELAEALGLYDEALQMARAARDDEKAMRAHANLAIVHKLRRALPEAVKHLDAATALAVSSGDVRAHARAINNPGL